MFTQITTSGWPGRWEAVRRQLPAVNFVIKGHPLHAVSTDWPAALIPTGFGFSLWGRLTDNQDVEKAGFLTTATGLCAAVPTAIFGLTDYLQMEVSDPAQPTGVTHALLNSAAVTFSVASLWGRSLRKPRSHRGLWFGGLATLALLASAYFGGDLVYHRGWRVKPIEREEIEGHRVPATVHDDDFVLRRTRQAPVGSDL